MKILDYKKPIDIFCEASQILNDAVIHTIGPNGTNSAVQNKAGYYEIINDGKSIIENITSLDPAISPALETLKQASFETNKKAGDGTTSTTVIMHSLLKGAAEYLNKYSNADPVELRHDLEEIRDRMLKILDKISLPLSEEDYENVASVALGSTEYANLISDAYRFLPKGKRPVLIKSNTDNIEVEKIDGVVLNKINLVSSLFIENTTEFNDFKVLLLFQPVNRFQELTQLLKKVQQNNDKPTLLLYNQLSTDILENLLFNYTNGAINLIPISISGYGRGTYSIFEDLATYLNTSIIDGTNLKINEISKIEFGYAKYGVINNEQLIIKKDNEKSEKKCLHLDEKSILFHVGGTNVVEREETYRRIEDAVNSLGNAIEHGIVPGAGVTYYNLIKEVEKEMYVPDFIKETMQLIKNKLHTEDTLEGIYDSVMVIHEVIQNAFTVVSQVITTQIVIHENIR